jgi:hypothetical protein
MSSEIRVPSRIWMDQLGRLVRSEGDRPFDGSLRLREEAIVRLLAGLRDLNRKHPYRVASYERVPAVQITSVDGRKTEIDFQVRSRAHVVTESFCPPSRIGLVSAGYAECIGHHIRGPFEFQPPVAPLDRIDRAVEAGLGGRAG